MSFFTKFTLCAGLVAALGLGTAQAALVSVTDTGVQTIDGQNFAFNFAGLGASNGAGGTFVVHARGDYDGGTDEALTWTIDGGTVAGGPVGGFVGGAGGVGGPFDFVTVFQPLGNIEFQRTYTLTPAQLSAILADGLASIFVDLNNGVGLFEGPNYVQVTLNYETGNTVPEPGSIALLGLGIAGLILVKRRKA